MRTNGFKPCRFMDFRTGIPLVYGCFYTLGVLFVGVLIIAALLLGVHVGAPDFWKLPYGCMDPGLFGPTLLQASPARHSAYLLHLEHSCTPRCKGFPMGHYW